MLVKTIRKNKSRVMVGHVLSLSLIDASKKETMKPIYAWKEGDKNVGVICDWFNLDHTRQRISGQLTRRLNKQCFLMDCTLVNIMLQSTFP